MKVKEARELLKKIIDEEETIETKLLKEILQSMNISLTSSNSNSEVVFLKKELKNQRQVIANQRNVINQLKAKQGES